MVGVVAPTPSASVHPVWCNSTTDSSSITEPSLVVLLLLITIPDRLELSEGLVAEASAEATSSPSLSVTMSRVPWNAFGRLTFSNPLYDTPFLSILQGSRASANNDAMSDIRSSRVCPTGHAKPHPTSVTLNVIFG